jgi:calcineurin-like phosphoesterase family protein
MKIVLEKGQRIFFTSDTHYGHSNICRATSNWGDDSKTRDFKSLDHMNTTLVDEINNKVGENDVLIHLGDFSFGGFDNIAEFRGRILCKNVHLILGNHDHHIERDKDGIRSLFKSVNHYAVLDVRRSGKDKEMEKYSIVLCHFPIASWDSMNTGRIHLHGHVHLAPHNKIAEGRAMDVGVDGNNLEPYSLDEILKLLRGRPIKRLTLPADHHESGEI